MVAVSHHALPIHTHQDVPDFQAPVPIGYAPLNDSTYLEQLTGSVSAYYCEAKSSWVLNEGDLEGVSGKVGLDVSNWIFILRRSVDVTSGGERKRKGGERRRKGERDNEYATVNSYDIHEQLHVCMYVCTHAL